MLSRKQRYLQIALNSTLTDATHIVASLPASPRILLEAGTPLIKQYGIAAISHLTSLRPEAYVVADLKCMDRGEREVAIARSGGASAAVALGQAPIETLSAFVSACEKYTIDSMIDMMNVEKPYQVLRKLTQLPNVVILHRGVDEEQYANKPLPIHMINKIKGAFNIMVAIAGGDTPREMQSAIFNGADIVVLWKHFYDVSGNAAEIVDNFLTTIK